jgi:hypothetical protein
MNRRNSERIALAVGECSSIGGLLAVIGRRATEAKTASKRPLCEFFRQRRLRWASAVTDRTTHAGHVTTGADAIGRTAGGFVNGASAGRTGAVLR